MPKNQHSTILSEQELQLLSCVEQPQHDAIFPLHSITETDQFIDIECKQIDTVEALSLLLSASPLGSGVILTECIEYSPHLNSLLSLLKQRLDIHIFWFGELPSMDIDLCFFDYCQDMRHLKDRIKHWEKNNLSMYSAWLSAYRVGIISEFEFAEKPVPLDELNDIKIYNAQQATNNIKNLQLLIIDLNTPKLRLIEILKSLIKSNESPFLLLYGDIKNNLTHAVYTLVNNLGFSILACLNHTPTAHQYKHILVALFSKIYLKHWVNDHIDNLAAQAIYNLSSHDVEFIFCPYGMSQKQITKINCPYKTTKIIHIQSVFDWFPDRLNRDDAPKLVLSIGCAPNSIDFYITQPQNISQTSPSFTLMVMARLNNTRVYWLVEDEQDFSLDMLMFLPISDLIITKDLADQLLDQPSENLLNFLEEAKQQHIRLGAVMEHNSVSVNALSLYGIDFLLGQRPNSH